MNGGVDLANLPGRPSRRRNQFHRVGKPGKKIDKQPHFEQQRVDHERVRLHHEIDERDDGIYIIPREKQSPSMIEILFVWLSCWGSGMLTRWALNPFFPSPGTQVSDFFSFLICILGPLFICFFVIWKRYYRPRLPFSAAFVAHPPSFLFRDIRDFLQFALKWTFIVVVVGVFLTIIAHGVDFILYTIFA